MNLNTILHRHLGRSLIQNFLICLISLLVVFLIGRMVQLKELFIGLNLSILDSLSLFFYLSPLFMLIILPLSTMFAVFLTFLRMNTNRELVALKAGGIGLKQILPSPLIFSISITLITAFISLYGIAWGMSNFRSLVVDIAHNRAKIIIQPGVFNQDIFGVTLFARQVDMKNDTLHDIIFEDRTQDKTGTSRIVGIASKGTLNKNSATNQLTFKLDQGKLYRLNGTELSVLNFGQYLINIDLEKIFSSFKLDDLQPKEMSWSQLKKLNLSDRPEEQDQRFWRKLEIEKQKRLALPVACIVLGLFAVPLAFALDGMGSQKGIPLFLVLFLAYYSLLSLGIGLSEAGALSPVIGLWLPNLVFAIFAAYGLHLANIERVPSLTAFSKFLFSQIKK